MSSSRVLVAAVPTSMGRRVGAYAIDLGVGVAIPLMLVSTVSGAGLWLGAMTDTPPTWPPSLIPVLLLLSWVGWALVYSAMQGGAGSIGQRLTGLRLTDADTDGRVGFGRALARNVVFHLAALIIVGFFSPLFDRSARRQGWHDLATGACVDDRDDPASAATGANDSALAPAGAPAYGAPVNATASAAAPTMAVERIAAPTMVVDRIAAPTRELVGATSRPNAFTLRPATTPAAEGADQSPSAASGAVVDQPPSTPSGHAVVAALTWDDGSRMAVYERTVCGRNPAREQGLAVLALRDETLSMSKTHFEIGGDSTGAWIVDRFSTNGTNLVRDDERIGLVPGLPAALHPGDRLEFGDRSAIVGGSA